MTGHWTTRRAVAAAAITLATLTASATASAEPLRLEPFSGPDQAEHVNHNGTSGSGNGSVDTTGSYRGDSFVGSAALAYAIDHPIDFVPLAVGAVLYVVVCMGSTLSGVPACPDTGGRIPPAAPN